MKGLAPWERLAKESAKAYEAFKAYRDLGSGRTIALAAETFVGRGKRGLSKWSATHCWVERCRSWDVEQDRLMEAQQRLLDEESIRKEQKAIDGMIDRHTALANAMSRKVAQDLAVMVKDKCAHCGAGKQQLKPADMARWLDVAAKLERVSHGLAADGKQSPLVQINNTQIVHQVNPTLVMRDEETRGLAHQLLGRIAELDQARRVKEIEAA